MNLPQTTLNTACSYYQITPEKATLIRYNQNLIYDCGDKILRFTPAAVRPFEEMEVELAYLLYLKKKQLPVVTLLPSTEGRYRERVGEGQDYFTVVCFEKIEGKVVTLETWGAAHFEQLGDIVGAFHLANRTYEAKGLQYLHWDEIVEHSYDRYLPKDERQLAPLFQKLSDIFKKYPKTPENYGIIHYDIHRGNYLLQENGAIIVFDFEMICQSWYLFDVATVLYYALSFPRPDEMDEAAFVNYFLHYFMKGYEKHRQIAKEELEWIPALFLYRDLMVYSFLLKIKQEKGASLAQEKYLSKLAEDIERRKVQF